MVQFTMDTRESTKAIVRPCAFYKLFIRRKTRVQIRLDNDPRSCGGRKPINIGRRQEAPCGLAPSSSKRALREFRE